MSCGGNPHRFADIDKVFPFPCQPVREIHAEMDTRWSKKNRREIIKYYVHNIQLLGPLKQALLDGISREYKIKKKKLLVRLRCPLFSGSF